VAGATQTFLLPALARQCNWNLEREAAELLWSGKSGEQFWEDTA
jgi:predicted ATP-dependent endonuclease of OLD family